VGNALATVASLIGAARGDQQVVKYADRLKAATAVAESLSALTFDQLNLEVSRSSAGDLQIKDMSVLSPSLRILGSGSIAYREAVPLWLQPLLLKLQLSAREEMATNLQALKLLKAEADALGYLPLVQEVNLEG